MSDKQQYETVKKIMEHPEITDEMEKVSPGIKSKMAGYLLSPWLPISWTRRIIMVIIIIVAIFRISISLWFLLLFLLPLFSPRIVGEIVRFFGKINRKH